MAVSAGTGLDIHQLSRSAFLEEIQGEGVELTEDELSRLESVFNFEAIQEYVDNDVALAGIRAAYEEKDEVIRERESYHERNIQNIARTIARRVAIEKRQRPQREITESKSEEFRYYAKTAGLRGCDIYPCEK